MTIPSHLKSLQALELAVRTGSLKAAADQLAISPAAVGQRVKALEDYLGIDLVVRGRSGLQPTPSLAGALPHLAAAFRELEAASAALDMQRAQEIHIAAVSDVAELWLAPRLAGFRAEHPNIRFGVNGEGEAPLRLGAMDCQIDFGPLREGADPLFGDFVLPISSPANSARIAPLPEAERLEGFPLLHLDFYRDDPAVPDWAEWIAERGMRREAPERGIRFRRIAPVLEAVRADAGVALCGLALIGDDLDAGRLTLPFPVATGRRAGHLFQARFRPEALARPPVRRFRDWLLAQGAATAAALAARIGGAG